jgi:SAM-dependent methyltransferase
MSELAQAWDEAAQGYERYWVPRFAPWVTAAVGALTEGTLPGDGPVLVPCCGTFPELPALRAAQPGREIVGVDLSPGMVELARARASGMPGVRVTLGDAAQLDPRLLGECAGVVSVFGLQQLPDAGAALGHWATALRPGGRLSAMFWPTVVESDGPFALVARVLARHRPPLDTTWESALVRALEEAGAVVEHDAEVAFPMSHPDASTFWAAMKDSGPLRAYAKFRGEEFMRGVEQEFLAEAPRGPWSHYPSGRLIVAVRRS